MKLVPVALLLGSVAAALAQAPPTPAAPPAVRDARRVAVVVSARTIDVVLERDDRTPKEIPDRVELRWDGRKLALGSVGRERYAGKPPGGVRRFSARLPKAAKPARLQLVDPAPAGSEPIRTTVTVTPERCVDSGPAGRLVTKSTRPGVSIAEVYPRPGTPGELRLSPAKGECAPPSIPPKDANRWDSHMSHTPRHDGTFFMAEDGFHHLEGVAACGRFTLYVYDDRVAPLPARSVSARVEYAGGKTVRLAPDRTGTVLEAPLPKGAKPPIDAVLRVELVPGFPEFRFDFSFPFVDPCPPPS